MTFRATAQQQSFFDAIEHTDENLAVLARAGTGKTTTALEAIPIFLQRNPRAEILFVAFGKAISVEINQKLKARGYDWRQVQASTSHALGWGLVKWQFKLTDQNINARKVKDLIRAEIDSCEVQSAAEFSKGNDDMAADFGKRVRRLKEFFSQILKLVDMAKVEGFGFFDPISDTHAWAQLAERYDIDGLELESDRDEVIAFAQHFYKVSLDKVDEVDFSDMILFPLVKNLRTKFQKDVVIIDEAQDTSKARQALIRRFVKPDGRVVVIGDDRQAIMAFAGADANAMHTLIEDFGASILPLTVTFRCPKSVVALCQEDVPDYEAHESNQHGHVLHLKEIPTDLVPGQDAILCRNIAPLIDIAYRLIRSGRPAKVEGRAIGEGLIALAKRWDEDSIDGLLHRLDLYEAREVQKAQAKGDDQKVEQIQDKVNTLREICRAVMAKGQTTVSAVIEFIESLFADGEKGVITLASYHRSKGREWKRVILYDHHKLSPSRYAKRPDQKKQEANLAYVAKSRAMEVLAFVTPPKAPSTKEEALRQLESWEPREA